MCLAVAGDLLGFIVMVYLVTFRTDAGYFS